MKKMLFLCVTVLLWAVVGLNAQTPDGNGVVYVNKNVVGSNGSGSSWANAALELADALRAANGNAAIKEIWVAAGTYNPMYYDGITDGYGETTADNRDKTFLITGNVNIYGGFAGGESVIDAREFETNADGISLPKLQTILSGRIGSDGVAADSVYHVVTAVRTSSRNISPLIDGVSITGGNNSDVSSGETVINGFLVPRIYGAGIYNRFADLTLSHAIVNENKAGGGGGMCNDHSSPQLMNVTISGNTAIGGGGMDNNSSSPVLTNVTISGNTASRDGGGMFNTFSSPVLTNVTISGNTASSNGCGMLNNSSSPVLTNVTISGNTAFSSFSGCGMFNDNSSSPEVNNTIIWGNGTNNVFNNSSDCFPVYKYSLVEGLNPAGDGNIDGTIPANAPTFVNAATGNYRLVAGSKGIDAGSNSLYNTTLYGNKDLAGSARICGTAIDMGAYEYLSITPDANGIVYVNKSITISNGNGLSWADACSELADALRAANGNAAIKQIWVAAGTYKPLYYDGIADNDNANHPTTDDRDKTFLITDNVKIYGGFVGGETSIDAREFETNADGISLPQSQTILSGVIGTAGTVADSVYHVVTAVGIDGSLISPLIDGVSITGGNSTDVSVSTSTTINGQTVLRRSGAGISNWYANLTLSHATVSGNSANYAGGGIYNAASSSPQLTNVTINGNSAFIGGGMAYYDSSPQITNVTISRNKADYGAGMCNDKSSSQLTNVTISGNTASSDGGGMYNVNSSSPQLTNVTIIWNTATTSGGGIYNYSSSPEVNNTIIWGNGSSNISSGITSSPVYKYSLVEGLNPTGGDNQNNIDGTIPANAPTFMDATTGNYRLVVGSKGIDAGSDALYPGTLATDKDLGGNPRKYGTSIDMGAYEYVSPLSQDATLSNLTVSEGTLTFAPGTDTYNVTVGNAVTSLVITATTNDANATVAGDGAKTLAVGANSFPIIVTAEDGVTTKTYTVNVILRAVVTTNDLDINITPKTYDGLPAAAATAAPKQTTTGLGTIGEIKYNGSTTVPTNAGTYSVTVDIAEGTHYDAYPNFPLGDLVISGTTPTVKSIRAASVTVSEIPSQTYTGAAFTPQPEVKDGTTVLVKDRDYTLSYSNNVNVGTATVTITGKGNYGSLRTETFTINRAAAVAPAPASLPEGLEATYGDRFSSMTLPAGFRWPSPSSTVGNAFSYPVTVLALYNPNPQNYEDYEVNLSLIIHQAQPFAQVVFPEAAPEAGTAALVYDPDRILSNIGLVNGTGPGTFSWRYPNTVPTVNQTEYEIAFTPTDANNYDYSNVPGWDSWTRTIIRTVTLAIIPRDIEIIEKVNPTYIYTGLPVTVTATVTISSLRSSREVTPALEYLFYRNGQLQDEAVNAGQYEVIARSADVNYRGESAPVSFTIEKAQPVILVNDTVANYTGNPVSIAYELTGSYTASGLSRTLKFTYEGMNGTVYSLTEKAPVEIGEYTVHISTPGSVNHLPAEAEISLKIVSGTTDLKDLKDFKDFKIYPNPAGKNSKLFLKSGQWTMDNGELWVEVYNTGGNMLRHIPITQKQTELRSESAEGIYLYVVKSKAGVLETMKIVVK